MYKITQPSKQDKICYSQRQAQYIQQTQDDSLQEDIKQIQTQLQKDELEQMEDFKSHLFNQEFSKNHQNIDVDLWKSIKQIEMRIQEQEHHFQKVNFDQQEEIRKLKNELDQQKYLYEIKIEEIKQSRILSSNSQINSPYSSENNREYNYRKKNNYVEEQQEKHYLQQLVQDLKQQIQVLQKKSYLLPNQNEISWEQNYPQQEYHKDNIQKICILETQIKNQKQLYENEISELKKQLQLNSQEDIFLRNLNQQLQQDLNSYKNKFNQVSQQLQQQGQQYQQQIYSLQLQLQNNQSFENKNQNQQQLLELTEQLQASTILLEKKIQECEFYKQKLIQQSNIHQNQQSYTHRLSLTPTKSQILTQNQNVFAIPNKQQFFKQFQ